MARCAPPPSPDACAPPAPAQLLDWLRDEATITFVTVRDPLERLKSAYEWRRYVTRGWGALDGETPRCQRGNKCTFIALCELAVYRHCYTTLNAFCERRCDGALCGGGWDADDATVRALNLALAEKSGPVRALRRQWAASTGRPASSLRVASCEDVHDVQMLTGHVGQGLAWYFSDVEPRLLEAIVRNADGGVLPEFPELGRLNPLFVVRNAYISEDINAFMEHHPRRLDFLVTAPATPSERSDLAAAARLAARMGVRGKTVPATHSAASERTANYEKDTYVSGAGEARMRGHPVLEANQALFDLMWEAQANRTAAGRG